MLFSIVFLLVFVHLVLIVLSFLLLNLKLEGKVVWSNQEGGSGSAQSSGQHEAVKQGGAKCGERFRFRRAVNHWRLLLLSERATKASRCDGSADRRDDMPRDRFVFMHTPTCIFHGEVEIKHARENSHSLQWGTGEMGTLWKVLGMFIVDISGSFFLSFFLSTQISLQQVVDSQFQLFT